MPVEAKKKLLKEIKINCILKSREYTKRHKKLKRIDQAIDLTVSFLNSCNLALLLTGLSFQPVWIGCIVCSSGALILSRLQQTYNLKHKYNSHNNTVLYYNDISREIITVLHKNHLTNEQLEDFIEYINGKINLIEDNEII